MNSFTIKDVENLSGIQAHTLRIWEQRYSFLKPQRTHSNIRYYSEDELKTILNVALLNRAGYRISRISNMTQEEMATKIVELSSKQMKHESIICQMIQLSLDMKLDEFDKLLSQTIDLLELQVAVPEVIFPFLERIGTLWMVGRANPAQEHFVSNIIRQKLLSETEKLPVPLNSPNKVLLFLPEGEMHELSILFMQYIIKKQGVQNWYLGANVPSSDVSFVAAQKKPTFLYTHVTGVIQSFSLDKFFEEMSTTAPDSKLVISGSAVIDYKGAIPENVQVLTSQEEAVHFFTSI